MRNITIGLLYLPMMQQNNKNFSPFDIKKKREKKKKDTGKAAYEKAAFLVEISKGDTEFF